MPTAPIKTGLVFFPAFDWRISPFHPEREERLLYTREQLIEEGLEDVRGISFFNPELAETRDINRVHFCLPKVEDLLTSSHFISAGGAVRAARAVMEKEVQKAFAVVRPPGHHAMQTVFGGRGFCLVNIEAVMVEYLRRHYGVGKVAIVDTDCHHGDGTQDIYYNDPDTLFISIHQDGRTIYPGSGFIDEAGGPAARGFNLNIPLPPQTSEQGFDLVMERVVLPVLEEFKPELIINSAGQDNHYTDPITNMNFTAQGYARLNRNLDPDICVLEGGYSIEGALPYTNLGIILAMAGMDTSQVCEPDYDPDHFRQSAAVNKAVEMACRDAVELFANRHQLTAAAKKQEQHVERRQVFYDTDYFQADETRVYHLCRKCPGFTEIIAAGAGCHLHSFSVPFNGCRACSEKARDKFAGIRKEKNCYIALQDRSIDLYEQVCTMG
ncbi:MAG: histone deacetylase [Deltaproteobacteria bacterium]|nr:MAG: histone deacetylase [Deltaproteobacteria bacterium]